MYRNVPERFILGAIPITCSGKHVKVALNGNWQQLLCFVQAISPWSPNLKCNMQLQKKPTKMKIKTFPMVRFAIISLRHYRLLRKD